MSTNKNSKGLINPVAEGGESGAKIKFWEVGGGCFYYKKQFYL